MERFFEHVIKEEKFVSDILSTDIRMKPLNAIELVEYEQATCCQNCKSPFTRVNPKTHHHVHVSGQHLFPTCNNCYLVSPLLR